MSILIKGMEMPPQGDYYITLYVCSDGSAYVDVSSFPAGKDTFVAVSVPPHGRLIDADAIEHDGWIASRIYQASLTENVFETKHVNAFPAIIEAEEGEI